MAAMPQTQGGTAMDMNVVLRKLMDSYLSRRDEIYREIEEAKRDEDVDAELTGEALYRQMRHIITELFQTMKEAGVLDEEEIEFGATKVIAPF